MRASEDLATHSQHSLDSQWRLPSKTAACGLTLIAAACLIAAGSQLHGVAEEHGPCSRTSWDRRCWRRPGNKRCVGAGSVFRNAIGIGLSLAGRVIVMADTVGTHHNAADRGAAEPRSVVGASDRILT